MKKRQSTDPLCVPASLKAAVDESARAHGISRSRYVARAVQKTLAEERGWRPEVLRAFQPGPTDDEDRETVEEMLAIIAAGRTREAPVSGLDAELKAPECPPPRR